MKKNNYIYVTTMHRGSQAYIAGISYDKNRATLYGKAEYYYRGGCGKYDYYTKKIKIPYKNKDIYLIEMWNDSEKNERFKYKVIMSRKKALEIFVEHKEENKYDNVKLKQMKVDPNKLSKEKLEWLHYGWQFLSSKEQEVLRKLWLNSDVKN